jgi:hypothetical protein
MVSACRHVKMNQQNRKDKYGQNIQLHCSCGKVTTGWHTERWKAAIAFRQIKEDLHNRGEL